MKLNRTDAQKQAKRLQSNPKLAPQSDDGRKEIVDCLLRHCVDEDHAERTMTRFLDTCKDPDNITAELAGCAAGTAPARIDELPEPCATCPADDWVPIDKEFYASVARHSCARGRALRERDKRAWAELEGGRKPQLKEFRGESREMRPAGDWAKRAAGDQ